MLVGMDRYRVYVRPGSRRRGDDAAELESAGRRGRGDRRSDSLDRAVPSRSSSTSPSARASVQDAPRRDEFVVRFQQTCGPAMAKAIEDTAYYRYVRLVGLNEVGGDPTQVGVPTEDFHAFAQNLLGEWPQSMTTLSTHDTKRAEDVRARLFVLAERPDAWATWVRTARELAGAGACRRARRADRVLPLADPRRRLADQRGARCRLTRSRRFASPSSTRGGPSRTRRTSRPSSASCPASCRRRRSWPRRVVGRGDRASRPGPTCWVRSSCS